jgi:hypothetical protein
MKPCPCSCRPADIPVRVRPRKDPDREYTYHNRRRGSDPVIRQTKREEWLTDDAVWGRLKTECCKTGHCLQAESFHNLKRSLRDNLEMTEVGVTNWLVAHLRQSAMDGVSPFRILGRNVCQIAFFLWHGLSDWKYRRACELLANGVREARHGGQGKRRDVPKRAWTHGAVQLWLDKVLLVVFAAAIYVA